MEFSAKAQAFLELFTLANQMGAHGIRMQGELTKFIYPRVDELAAILGAELPATMKEVVDAMEAGDPAPEEVPA